MTHSLVHDLGVLVLPVAAGVLAFLLGRTFARWPVPVRAGVLTAAMAALAAAVLSMTNVLPPDADRLLSRAGGGTALAAGVALLLLGVVWAAPGRSTSSTFLALVSGVCVLLIALDTGGPLWFRFGEKPMWARTPAADGRLRQSSGMTCSPTAAAMLLGRYGVPASEGEMAYLAGTSPFGTDTYGIARALDAKLAGRGLRAAVERPTYAELEQLGGPFLAHVRGQQFGHAVLVTRFADKVEVFDPADGEVYELTPAEFEKGWDGAVVRVVPAGQ